MGGEGSGGLESKRRETASKGGEIKILLSVSDLRSPAPAASRGGLTAPARGENENQKQRFFLHTSAFVNNRIGQVCEREIFTSRHNRFPTFIFSFDVVDLKDSRGDNTQGLQRRGGGGWVGGGNVKYHLSLSVGVRLASRFLNQRDAWAPWAFQVGPEI